MMIGRMLAPVHALGPGSRVALWTIGCSKHCEGCISPELKKRKQEKDISVEFLAQIMREASQKNNCKGLTISGGDPFEQPEELLKLLKVIRKTFEDILVYTGFLYEEIEQGKYGEEAKEALAYIDVLVDGPYIKERNVSDSVLRGSDNQKILFLNPSREKEYMSYLKEGRQLENFHLGNNVITVGIPDRRFKNEEIK